MNKRLESISLNQAICKKSCKKFHRVQSRNRFGQFKTRRFPIYLNTSNSSSSTYLEFDQSQRNTNQIHQQENEEDKNNFSRVVYPNALALLLCNMDRMCMSVAILPMSTEFQWSESVKGLIQVAYAWGYLATQIVGGVFADKFSGNLVMEYGIMWFSAATMSLPIFLLCTQFLASSQVLLMLVLFSRFLVGMGQGVTLPAMTNLVGKYVEPNLRATAFGNIFTGFHSGNLVALILSPLIIEQFGWHALFIIFGLLGVPMVYIFKQSVPNFNDSNQTQNNDGQKGEQSAQKSIGIKKLLSTPACIAICLTHFMNNWGYFILLGWMPTFFSVQLGFNLRDSSYFSILPWLVMAVGSSTIGVISDKLLKAGYSLRLVRIGIQAVSTFGTAASMLMMAQKNISKEIAIILLMLTLGFKSMASAGFQANVSDVAPKNSGELFGLSSSFGGLAGIIGLGLVGVLVEKTGSFQSVFLLTGIMYILSGIIWVGFGTTEQIFY